MLLRADTNDRVWVEGFRRRAEVVQMQGCIAVGGLGEVVGIEVVSAYALVEEYTAVVWEVHHRPRRSTYEEIARSFSLYYHTMMSRRNEWLF